MTTQPIPTTTTGPAAANAAELTPVAAWSRRVRLFGGFIQTAFAAFWLTRASLTIGGPAGNVLIAASGAAVIGVVTYAVRNTAGTAPRPTGPEASRIGRPVGAVTVIQLAASFALPVVLIAAGRPGWVLPSIVITIGMELLWLGHKVHIPRLRLVGWALIAGPVILAATMSGPALAVATGLGAGVLLLGSAAAGFHDLARIRRARQPGPAQPGTTTPMIRKTAPRPASGPSSTPPPARRSPTPPPPKTTAGSSSASTGAKRPAA